MELIKFTFNDRLTIGKAQDAMYTCVYDYSSTHCNKPFALVAARSNSLIKDTKYFTASDITIQNEKLLHYKNKYI